jgi:fatty acid desaturase
MKSYLIRNNTKALFALLRDWSAIALIVWLNTVYPSIYLYLPSIWLIGAFQFALSESMLHEAAHHNLFAQKQWNYRLEFLYAYPFFRTVRQFRAEHLVHHNRLVKEPDRLVEDYQHFGLFGQKPKLFFIWFIKPITGYAGFYYFSTIRLKPFKQDGWKICLFWAVILSVFIVTGKLIFLLKFWIIPMFWSCYSYLYWSEISDHFNTISGTRSNISIWTNFITHNNGYHYIHHKYPTIPWFRLKKAYRELTPDEGDVSRGFLHTYRQMVTNQPVSVKESSN